jgi:predicted amidohydrolase YtcJ
MDRGAADLVLLNARVLTMDDRRPQAHSLAVRGGRIVALDGDASGWTGKRTRVIDLRGRFVMPGFHDSHNHMLMTGRALILPDLSRARRIADVLEVVRTAAEQLPAGTWIETSARWHESRLTEWRFPTCHELDRAAPAHPVFMRRGAHNVVLNSLALDLAGIGPDTTEPSGTTYVRDPATGDLTGHVTGTTTVVALAGRLLPRPSPEELREVLRSVMDRYARAGITSVVEPGLNRQEMAAYHELADAGELTLRVNMMWRLLGRGEPAATAVERIDGGEVEPDLSGEWLRTLAIKLGVDGGVETGFYREPYVHADDPAHPCGKPLLARDDLAAVCAAAARRGWQVGVHCVGDAGIDTVLDAYEAVHRETPIDRLRWTLIHMMYPREDHWDRVNRLSLAITAQQPLLYALAAGFTAYIGSERTADIEPIAAYLSRSGRPVGGGSDSPVAPYEPLLGVASSVTRQTQTGVVGARWAVGVDDALRMYTRGSAWCTFEEDVKGVLREGAYADLVVLADDPREVDPAAIAEIDVLLTMTGGRVTHDRLG